MHFASFRLLRPARDWWLRKKEEYDLRQQVWTWTEFLAEFKKKFIPCWVMERREHEFFNLQQGNRTVEEYAAEFTRLSKSCPVLVTAETDRVRRFTKGLRLDLQKALIGMVPATFSAAVETATRIEGKNIEHAKKKGKEG
jgi:hypothetical protein